MLYYAPDPKLVAAKREEDYFGTAKRYLLNDPRELMDIMLNFEKPGITPQQLQRLEERVLNLKDFNLASVERCSYATKFLYFWVRAMANFTYRWIETEPMRETLHAAKK